jgi:hypothetical protein
LIALRLTKCFYNLSGLIHLFPVTEHECNQTSKMSGSAYSIFLMMKFHWTNLCHFSKDMAFTGEVSQGLAQLFRSMISWSPVMREFRHEMRTIVREMKVGIEDLDQKAENLTKTATSIEAALEDFGHYVDIASNMMDLALFLVDNLTFYFTALVFLGFFGIVIPRIVGPAVFATIVLFVGDRILAVRWSWWNDSGLRYCARQTYAFLWIFYPVAIIIRFSATKFAKRQPNRSVCEKE